MCAGVVREGTPCQGTTASEVLIGGGRWTLAWSKRRFDAGHGKQPFEAAAAAAAPPRQLVLGLVGHGEEITAIALAVV